MVIYQKTKKDDLFNHSLKIFLLSFLFLFSFTLVSSANTATFIAPVADGRVSGSTSLINITFDTNGFNIKLGNITYEIPGISTSNTTITGILIHNGTLDSDPEGIITFNGTWDTTAVTDRNNLTFWFSSYNDDMLNNTVNATITGVDLDNGMPTATLASNHFPDLTRVSKSDTFTIATSADSTIGYNSCRAFFTNTRTSAVDNITVIEASSNACSNTITTSNVGGLTSGDSYNVVVQVEDDNTNKTNSSSRVLVYKSTQGAPVVVQIGGEAPKTTIQIFTSSLQNAGNSLRNVLNKLIDMIRFWD